MGTNSAKMKKSIWNISDMNDLVEQCRTIEDILKNVRDIDCGHFLTFKMIIAYN